VKSTRTHKELVKLILKSKSFRNSPVKKKMRTLDLIRKDLIVVPNKIRVVKRKIGKNLLSVK